MSREVIISDEAALDTEEAFLWYLAIETKLANDFEAHLYKAFDDILSHPNSFQKRYKNVRIRFLRKFPYGVHYLVQENAIIIAGVFHTSRDLKNWFDRIGLNDLFGRKTKIKKRNQFWPKAVAIQPPGKR